VRAVVALLAIAGFLPARQNNGLWNSKRLLSTNSTPTPEQEREQQERELRRVLGLRRWLHNTALEQRIIAWQRAHLPRTVSSGGATQGHLRRMPEYTIIHSHALQDARSRLDKTYRAFFRRVQRGKKADFPCFQGRYHSFPYKAFGNGAMLDSGFLVLSKIGCLGVRWSRAVEGAIKTVTISQEADDWDVCFSCVEAPVQSMPETDQETGVDLGIEAIATLSDGTHIFPPGWCCKAERALKSAQRRVSRRKKGGARRGKDVELLAKAHPKVQWKRADFHYKTALAAPENRASARL
jgi:putative transposase